MVYYLTMTKNIKKNIDPRMARQHERDILGIIWMKFHSSLSTFCINIQYDKKSSYKKKGEAKRDRISNETFRARLVLKQWRSVHDSLSQGSGEQRYYW